jgi:hypothetical protein
MKRTFYFTKVTFTYMKGFTRFSDPPKNQIINDDIPEGNIIDVFEHEEGLIIFFMTANIHQTLSFIESEMFSKRTIESVCPYIVCSQF